MTSAQYYLLAAALIVAAWTHHRDVTTPVLALGLLSSVVAPGYRAWPELIAWLAVIDAFTVVAMGAIWTRWHSMRAWSIGFIGLGKTAWSLALAGGIAPISIFTYSIVLNCAFLLQVIVAGGFIDAFGYWLDDLLRRVLPRRHRLLRNGGE